MHISKNNYIREFISFLLLSGLVLTSPLVMAALQNWNVATADWFTAGSWAVGGVPADGDITNINNGGTANILSGTASTNLLNIGNNAANTGTVTIQNNGTTLTAGTILIGINSATGVINILDGGQVTSTNLSIGINTGVGTLNIANGAVLNVSNAILVGNSAGSVATFNVGTGGAAAVVNAPSLQGLVGNSNVVNFNHTNSNYYFTNNGAAGGTAVLLTGTLAVKQIGSGTTILSGTNSYTGGTTVSAGNLQGTTSSLQGAISNSASVTFDQATSGTYSGIMSGTGALTKKGAGTLTLSGTNNYTGATTVSSGTLLVTGSLAAGSTVTVAAGAVLGGSGTINGNVVLDYGARLLSTLTVTGSISYTAFSVYSYLSDIYHVGALYIGSAGTVDGGYLQGAVSSQGQITGTMLLGADTVISGGSIAGEIKGAASSPARINAAILAGTRLENVIIGIGSTVDPTVIIGANVRFDSATTIPANLDLTAALDQLPWFAGRNYYAPNLDGTVINPGQGSLPGNILSELKQLIEEAYPGTEVTQNSRGLLLLRNGPILNSLLPSQVRQPGLAAGSGISFSDDGDIVISASQNVLVNPILLDSDAFSAELASAGLLLSYDEHLNVIVSSPKPVIAHYFVGRAGTSVFPAPAGKDAGLYGSIREALPGVKKFYFVFRSSENEQMLQQDLVPFPADWTALKQALMNLPRVSAASINFNGVISVLYQEQVIRLLADYQLTSVHVTDNAHLILNAEGDLNGDGTQDFSLVYANGFKQVLYRYPSL